MTELEAGPVKTIADTDDMEALAKAEGYFVEATTEDSIIHVM